MDYNDLLLDLVKRLRELELKYPDQSEELIREYLGKSRNLALDLARERITSGLPFNLADIRLSIFRFERAGYTKSKIAEILQMAEDDIDLIKEAIPYTAADDELRKIMLEMAEKKEDEDNSNV